MCIRPKDKKYRLKHPDPCLSCRLPLTQHRYILPHGELFYSNTYSKTGTYTHSDCNVFNRWISINVRA